MRPAVPSVRARLRSAHRARAAPRSPGATRTGFLVAFVAGPLALLALLAVHLTQGAAGIGAAEVLRAIYAPDGSLGHNIVRHLRLPRAAAGALAGAALGVAGVLLQSVTRNPLASPATLGVNAGAYFAVVATVVLAPGLAAASPVSVAFAGGLLAAALVYAVSGGLSATPVRLALAGVAVAMALSALTTALQVFFEHESAGLFFWGQGSLLQNDWARVASAAPQLALALGAALLAARALDVLALGDDAARALGQRVRATRLGASALGVFLAAVAVSVSGPIGFVGLVAPHLVRLAGVRRHLPLMLGAAVWGAVVLVGADVLARAVTGGIREVPAGVVTALVGAPAFVLLARRAAAAGVRAGAGGARSRARPRAPYAVVVALAAALLAAAVACGVLLGTVRVEPRAALDALLGGGPSFVRRIVVDLRMPRVVVAAAAGGALAASGLLLQGVVRNPLAAPETLGVTSGAGVGALAMLLAFPHAPLEALPLAAFAGAFSALAVTYAAAWRGGLDPARLALVGIAVSAFLAAVANLLVIQNDVRVAEALVWLAGSTYARSWDEVRLLLPWALALIPFAWVAGRTLDVLALGDDAARALGVRLEAARGAVLVVAVALAAAAVSSVGVLAFVGLVAPHAARLLVGSGHRRVLPVAVLLGAALVAGADVVGRLALSPKEIPSGLVTALLGTPYFVWLLWRTRAAGA